MHASAVVNVLFSHRQKTQIPVRLFYGFWSSFLAPFIFGGAGGNVSNAENADEAQRKADKRQRKAERPKMIVRH